MVRRVLISGGSGQVGRALLRSKPDVCMVYSPDRRRLDITDPESVSREFSQFRPEVVINAAAYTAVDRAESERDLAFAVNADGAGNLARACRVHSIPLVHLSTDYVFDGNGHRSYSEDDQPNPINVYGASKLAGERQVQDAGAAHLILRVSWVFSADGTNFVRTMLKLAANERLRVVNDQRGTPSAAADIAALLWMLVGRLDVEDHNQVLHYGSVPATTWFEFARLIFDDAKALGLISRAPDIDPITTDQYPTAARRPSNSLLDSTRLQNFLGWQPPDWRKSLRNVLLELRQ